MLTDKKNIIAIIGGGRWARTTLSVLLEFDTIPFDHIIIVTKHNKEIMENFLTTYSDKNILVKSTKIISSIEETLMYFKIQAAIVINSAREHFKTANYLLDHGVNLLIEKPITLSLQDATSLLKKAELKKVCLVPVLNYRYCTYLHNFAKIIEQQNIKPKKFVIEWYDSLSEKRYGETKTFDSSINIAQDIMSHIYIIIKILFRSSNIDIINCSLNNEDKTVVFTVSVMEVIGKIVISRDLNIRKRKISIDSGLELDFTKEPGTITTDSGVINGDSSWDENPKPLKKQLSYFFSQISTATTSKQDIEDCLGSVSLTERASLYYNEQYSGTLINE